MMKSLTLFGTFLLAVVPVSGQSTPEPGRSSPAATPKMPTRAEMDLVLKRIYGYDPSIQWNAFEIRQSPVPGMSEVVLRVKDEFQHLFLTADGHYAIKGDMLPFGPDPYAIARSRLRAAQGPAHGPAKPALVMVEFSDLQCPHCKDAQPIMEKLAADFPQMKIIFQQYPLAQHPWATKAAQYVDCAGRVNNDAAWKYIADIYENQAGIALAIADDKLKELATAAGLDAEKLSACAADPDTAARIQKSVDLGDSVGVMGPPSIFVNGRLLDTVVGTPYEKVKAIVQYEIDHAGK